MKQDLHVSLKEAMKAQDKIKVETIRSLMSALQYEAMQQGVEELEGAPAFEVLNRELKKRKEELEFAQQANRNDAKERVEREISVIQLFLPQQLDSATLEKTIQEIRSASPGAGMGAVMKTLKERLAGQYDAKLASEIAKRICV